MVDEPVDEPCCTATKVEVIRKAIVFVAEEWGVYHTGVWTVNCIMAASLSARKDYDIYCILGRPHGAVTVEERSLAAECGVKLLGARCDRKLHSPPEGWLRQTGFYDYGLKNVRYVIGHSPWSGGAAMLMKKDFYSTAELIIVHHGLPSDAKRANKLSHIFLDTVKDYADFSEEASAMFCVGSTIFQAISKKYVNTDGVFLYLPHFGAPTTLTMQTSSSVPPVRKRRKPRSPRNEHRRIMTFGSVIGKPEITGYDITAHTVSKVSDYYHDLAFLHPRWTVQGLSLCEMEHRKTKDIFNRILTCRNCHFSVGCYVSASRSQRAMQRMNLCFAAQRADLQGMTGLEAILNQVPFIVSSRSAIADLITAVMDDEDGRSLIVTVFRRYRSFREADQFSAKIIDCLKSPSRYIALMEKLSSAIIKEDGPAYEAHTQFLQFFGAFESHPEEETELKGRSTAQPNSSEEARNGDVMAAPDDKENSADDIISGENVDKHAVPPTSIAGNGLHSEMKNGDLNNHLVPQKKKGFCAIL